MLGADTCGRLFARGDENFIFVVREFSFGDTGESPNYLRHRKWRLACEEVKLNVFGMLQEVVHCSTIFIFLCRVTCDFSKDRQEEMHLGY
jgi:hypothetical protein